MKHLHLVCTLALLFAACSDPLVDPQTVIGLRVLGAKLTPDEDPSLAQVAPGQNATLNWLVVSDRERSYRALTLSCKAEPSRYGVPRCGSKFFEQRIETSTDVALSFAFAVPEDFADEQEWLSFLALCEDGEPRWNKSTQRFSCTSEDQPVTSFYRGVWHEDANHNPSLQDDELEFDDDAWLPTDETEASCDTADVAVLPRDAVVKVRLSLAGSDAETLDDPSYAAASKESLTYTHVATTAGLARAFSAIDPDTKAKSFELDLNGEDAWADVQKQQVGTFYLVVSDGRGGSDWLRRHYCLSK